MLGPTTLFVVTISITNAVKVFETVKMLTDGGPNKASEVLLFTIYQEGFVYLRVGEARTPQYVGRSEPGDRVCLRAQLMEQHFERSIR